MTTQPLPLPELLDKVIDRDSFLMFLDALVADLNANPTTWKSLKLDAFLIASRQWAAEVSDVDDHRRGWFPREPRWRSFARMLLAGKSHE